jgi:hypothetical protein
MAKRSNTRSSTSTRISGNQQKAPASLAIAKDGIQTGRDFARFMSALMSDLIEGKITPGVGNAAVNAGGKLLKVVELQMKYGHSGSGSGEKVLDLTGQRETATLTQ